MPLVIDDDRIEALARQLAELEGRPLEQALREALADALEREKEIQEKIRKSEKILAEVDAMPDLRPGFTDKDLYDEDGNPIL